LPKPAVDEIEVDATGVVGDFNRYRHEELHDDPDSALLILPEEILAELRSEGWPVRPGDLGENVSSRQVPYALLQPSSRVAIGAVRAVITRPCDPCSNLYLLPYVGEHRGPEFMKTLLNRRGWYARVLTPGRVHLRDPIVLD
ncbi:MOSC domain containing protein, partial [mine drainage metagenome]